MVESVDTGAQRGGRVDGIVVGIEDSNRDNMDKGSSHKLLEGDEGRRTV